MRSVLEEIENEAIKIVEEAKKKAQDIVNEARRIAEEILSDKSYVKELEVLKQELEHRIREEVDKIIREGEEKTKNIKSIVKTKAREVAKKLASSVAGVEIE